MKITLATPLYPPDTEPIALYYKELAKRLSHEKHHQVTVVTYGKLPEKISEVDIVTVDKSKPIFIRIALYTLKLWRAMQSTDILYIQNGASVEFPTLVTTMIMGTPFVLFSTDKNVAKQTQNNRLRHMVNQAIIRRARVVITEIPPEKPEILSFSPRPEHELLEYENSWTKHLQKLSEIVV